MTDGKAFIKGEKLYLRPLNENDVAGDYSSWLNDKDVTMFNSHGRFPMSNTALLNYVKEVENSRTSLVLAIVEKENNKHIGNISLQNINWLDRNAEIAFLLGNKEYWLKGFMAEAAQLIIIHGFKTLNLRRIYCGTSSRNLGMQKLAVKLKMVKEGVRRDAIFKNGEYEDIIEYGILSNEI